MKAYKSHKIVSAAKIISVEKAPGLNDSPITVVFTEDGQFWKDQAVFARGVPEVGDYIVRYDDNYVSWSPAKAFEEGYKEHHGDEAYVPLPPDPVAVQIVDSALKGISKGQMDTGGGFGCRDYWATINGVEHFISMQRSKRQILLDQGTRLPPSEKLLGKDTSA